MKPINEQAPKLTIQFENGGSYKVTCHFLGTVNGQEIWCSPSSKKCFILKTTAKFLSQEQEEYLDYLLPILFRYHPSMRHKQ